MSDFDLGFDGEQVAESATSTALEKEIKFKYFGFLTKKAEFKVSLLPVTQGNKNESSAAFCLPYTVTGELVLMHPMGDLKKFEISVTDGKIYFDKGPLMSFNSPYPPEIHLTELLP